MDVGRGVAIQSKDRLDRLDRKNFLESRIGSDRIGKKKIGDPSGDPLLV